jgi:hypothetical protein
MPCLCRGRRPFRVTSMAAAIFRAGLLLLVVEASCRRTERVAKPEDPDDTLMRPVIEAYAADLAEVVHNAQETASRMTPRDPDAAMVRAPSPAIGTRLAARTDVIDVETRIDSSRVQFRMLHGTPGIGASTVGTAVRRGEDEILAFCPAMHDDDNHAVSIQIRRENVHVTVTVRVSQPVCPERLLAERAKEIRVARAFVGQEEEAYLAYFDVVRRTCSTWADGDNVAALPLPPFAGRTGLRKVGGQCVAADKVVSRGLAGPPALTCRGRQRHENALTTSLVCSMWSTRRWSPTPFRSCAPFQGVIRSSGA